MKHTPQNVTYLLTLKFKNRATVRDHLNAHHGAVQIAFITSINILLIANNTAAYYYIVGIF